MKFRKIYSVISNLIMIPKLQGRIIHLIIHSNADVVVDLTIIPYDHRVICKKHW